MRIFFTAVLVSLLTTAAYAGKTYHLDQRTCVSRTEAAIKQETEGECDTDYAAALQVANYHANSFELDSFGQIKSFVTRGNKVNLTIENGVLTGIEYQGAYLQFMRTLPDSADSVGAIVLVDSATNKSVALLRSDQSGVISMQMENTLRRLPYAHVNISEAEAQIANVGGIRDQLNRKNRIKCQDTTSCDADKEHQMAQCEFGFNVAMAGIAGVIGGAGIAGAIIGGIPGAAVGAGAGGLVGMAAWGAAAWELRRCRSRAINAWVACAYDC